MNFIDQVYVALIYVGSELYKYQHIIMGVLLAMTISVLKTSKERKPQNWGENVLCGIFAGIALTGIGVVQYLMGTVFNFPAELTIPTSFITGIVAGFIAWYGTEGTIKLIKDKVYPDDSKDSDNSE